MKANLSREHNVTRPLTPGIYAPLPTFFLPDSEDLDIATFKAHVERICTAGVFPVIAGTMGEAIHLSHDERATLIRTARETLDLAGLTHMPLIAGTGAGSTRETIELCKEAENAGADYAIVIASGYFAGALSENKKALKAFWSDVAENSPIPVMIYNYPAASAGIDLDSDFILDLAANCPNICGVKLTCGNVGKLTRIAHVVSNPSFAKKFPRKNSDAPFLVLGGLSDFLLPSTITNGHGAITGLANIAPYSLVGLHALSKAARKDMALLPSALKLQVIIAHADFRITNASIAGTKFLLEKLYGYGGVPRRPLLPLDSDVSQALWDHPDTQYLIEMERESNLI